MKAAEHIEIFDTTLRDGAQGEGITFSVQDKIAIARALDELGVDWIEAGNPGSNPKDLEFFRSAGDLGLQTAKLCAFGATRKKGVTPDKEVIVYCQTHHRSAHTYWVLRYLGYPKVRGYAGSWSEWGNDLSLPIES